MSNIVQKRPIKKVSQIQAENSLKRTFFVGIRSLMRGWKFLRRFNQSKKKSMRNWKKFYKRKKMPKKEELMKKIFKILFGTRIWVLGIWILNNFKTSSITCKEVISRITLKKKTKFLILISSCKIINDFSFPTTDSSSRFKFDSKMIIMKLI